jgi:hypothetical protein
VSTHGEHHIIPCRECVVAQTSVSCQCKSSRGTGAVKVISSQLSFGSLTSIYGFILSNNSLSARPWALALAKVCRYSVTAPRGA